MNKKNTLTTEWKNHWNKKTIAFGLKQIQDETYYTECLTKLFKKRDKVLEAGCGLGRYCFWLDRKGVKAIGIDITKQAITKANQYAKEKIYKCQFVTGDVRKLPFNDNYFDGYISLGVIEHFRDRKDVFKTFSETFRVLKSGGHAFITIPNSIAIHMLVERISFPLRKKTALYHQAISKKDLYQYAKTAGFSINEIFYHDCYFPLYSLIRFAIRRDIYWLKKAMRISLNIFDQVPIIKNLGSGIALIAQKPK